MSAQTSTALRGTHLLIIDPQNDFCDLPAAHLPPDPVAGGEARTAPALPVGGAHADMQRLARFIDRHGAALDEITVTLDAHHRHDIAHPTFWQRGDGAPVTPFTAITAQQVRSGEFTPRQAAALPRTLAYLDELEARGRYTLMVWPVHCEIGTWGQGVHADVRTAYNRWEEAGGQVVRKVSKGSNPWTEHYSAVQAEVPDEEDAATQVNEALIAPLRTAERIVIAGQASSHCVRATTEHLVQQLGTPAARRMVLLTDCMSPVAGFDAAQREFFATLSAWGATLAHSTDVAL
ncbi:MAG: cysteine hydrolase [Pseudomonadota bacterium]